MRATPITQTQFLAETGFRSYTDKILAMYKQTPASFFDFYVEYMNNEEMRREIGFEPSLQITAVYHNLFEVIELMWVKARSSYGVVLYDLTDRDFACVALRQGENPKDSTEWGCYWSGANFNTPSQALKRLEVELF